MDPLFLRLSRHIPINCRAARIHPRAQGPNAGWRGVILSDGSNLQASKLLEPKIFWALSARLGPNPLRLIRAIWRDVTVGMHYVGDDMRPWRVPHRKTPDNHFLLDLSGGDAVETLRSHSDRTQIARRSH